ncbi:MAG: hypothetical protein EZS28_047169, partial [Streblomastix strix]
PVATSDASNVLSKPSKRFSVFPAAIDITYLYIPDCTAADDSTALQNYTDFSSFAGSLCDGNFQ